MTLRASIMKFTQQDDVNFLLTNAFPRRLVTTLVGWFSRIENPLVCKLSLRVWQVFAELDLAEAETTQFRSLHDCFTRRLKPGARPIDADPALLVSPCDGIVGACGMIEEDRLLQVKGSYYPLAELLGAGASVAPFRGGVYVTLRLTSSMYHHFHAPHDAMVESVTHIPGAVWNVNPPTLRRIERLFCRNERAVVSLRLASGQPVLLVAVAAVLVAGIRLSFMDLPLRGSGRVGCAVPVTKGEELGWFEHGSTIIVLAPPGFRICEGVASGVTIRVGRPLVERKRELLF